MIVTTWILAIELKPEKKIVTNKTHAPSFNVKKHNRALQWHKALLASAEFSKLGDCQEKCGAVYGGFAPMNKEVLKLCQPLFFEVGCTPSLCQNI